MKCFGCVRSLAGEPGRIAPLDGLRALAITLVLLRHGVLAYGGILPQYFAQLRDNWLFTFMLNGWAGVDLFFVLSGFLVGYHLLSRWPATASKLIFISKYWLKRVLRTFPLYYAILAIVALELIPFYQHQADNVRGALLTHLVFLQDYAGANLLVPLWSLATEEKFYFFCPFLLWLIFKLPKSRYTIISVFALLLSLPLFNRLLLLSGYSPQSYTDFFWAVRAPFHMVLDGLLFGLLLAFLYRDKILVGFFVRYNQGIILFCALALGILLSRNEWMEAGSYWQATALVLFLLALLFAVLLYASIFSAGKIKAYLSSLPLRFISKLSYSLYLCHMLIIPLALAVCNATMSAQEQPILFFCIFFSVYLSFSFTLSVLLHVSIERPFLYLKDKVRL